jgi:hypothetical protein
LLKHVYAVVQKEGASYTLLYWLALPTLIFVQLLGAGKHDDNGLNLRASVVFDYDSKLKKGVKTIVH